MAKIDKNRMPKSQKRMNCLHLYSLDIELISKKVIGA